MTIEEFYNRFDFNADATGSEIGRGGFSVVYKAYDKIRKRFVAIKRSEVGQFSKFDLKREVEIANEIDPHINILRYENVYRFTERLTTHDFAVMRYYPEGNLENVIKRHHLTELEQLNIMKGILHGLAHIHQIPIIHRDFKTANILMDKNEKGEWVPLICDFGQSRLLETENSIVNNNSQIALTPKYSAPEQLLDTKTLRTNADLWAFGVIIYQMLKGKLPFTVEDNTGDWGRSEKIRSLILQGEIPKGISTIREPYQTIIRQCLIVDPEKRVKSANELLYLLEKVQPVHHKTDHIHDVSDKTVVFSNTNRPPIPKIKPVETPISYEVSTAEKKPTFNYYLIIVLLLAIVGGYFLFLRKSPTVDDKVEAILPGLDSSTVMKINIKPDTVKAETFVAKGTQKTKPEIHEQRKSIVNNSLEGTIQIRTDNDCMITIDGKSYGRLRGFQTKNIVLKGVEGGNPYKNYVVTLEKENGEKIVENILVFAGRTNSKQLNFDN